MQPLGWCRGYGVGTQNIGLHLQASKIFSSGSNVCKFLAPVPEWFGPLKTKNHCITWTIGLLHKICLLNEKCWALTPPKLPGSGALVGAASYEWFTSRMCPKNSTDLYAVWTSNKGVSTGQWTRHVIYTVGFSQCEALHAFWLQQVHQIHNYEN